MTLPPPPNANANALAVLIFAVVVTFLPILINLSSLRTGIKASSVLMPMGFSTLLGGTCTTIATSTNLPVVSVAAEMGLKRMGMFDCKFSI